MKIKKRLFIILLLCIGIGVGFFYALQMDPTHETEITEMEKENTVQLKGKIVDATMNTMIVRDEQNNQYLLSHMDLDVKGAPIIIGNDVVVKYKGTLKKSDELQDIHIEDITVQETQIKNIDVSENKEEPVSKGHTKDIADLLDSMTLKEKVAQMFFVRCPDEDATQFVKDYQIGGYILFGQDFKGKTSKEVKNHINNYQKNSNIPMLIGVNEEGGTVVRASRYLREEKFQSPQQLYKKGGMDAIVKDSEVKSQFLLDLGINVNFAPVADVSTHKDDFINSRTFGKDAKQTSHFVKTVIQSMEKSQIGSVLKHFPGYGNNKDTHTQICVDNREYSIFEKSDFLPFQAGTNAGAEFCIGIT